MDQEIQSPLKGRLIASSSFRAAPPPSPIPTAKGCRSAADPILSEQIEKSIRIPKLTLPQNAHRFKPEEINYETLLAGENVPVTRLLSSIREFGVIRIVDHAILTEELRFALADCDRIFGLKVDCITSYGDHERFEWRGGEGDRSMAAAIGQRSFRIFRQKLKNVARELQAIGEELTKVIDQNVGNQFQYAEPTLSIYRYHRADITDQISPINIGETSQESDPYAFSLHVFLESGEFCLQPGPGLNWSSDITPGAIVVTVGKELEEWSKGKFKSAHGKLMFKPFHRKNRPSFSIEQKWSRNVVGAEPHKIISLRDQILFLVFVTLLYNFYAYI